jgi:hypothetical protein
MYLLLQPDPTQTQPYPAPIYPQNAGILQHMSFTLQQSVDSVLALLIRILPFVVTLALMTAVGILASWVLRKILTAARFDERVARNRSGSFAENGLADWSPGHSPTALVGRVVFWAFVLLGLATGISAFDPTYASESLSPTLLPYITRSAGAVLLLLAGNLIAQFLARTVLIGAVNNQLQYARFLSMGVKWLVLVLTAAMVLDHLQIGGTIVELAFGILFGGIVLTLSLAVGLGSRDLVTRSLQRGPERTPRPPTAYDQPETSYPATPADPLGGSPLDQPAPPRTAQSRPDTLRHF